MNEALVELSDDAFEALVNGDVRGTATGDTSAFLRSPENARRWLQTLLRLKRKVESQFMSHRADLILFQAQCMKRGPSGLLDYKQYEGQEEKWRSNAIRFLHGLEEAIAEAKDLTGANDRSGVTMLLQAEIERLRDAIREHKNMNWESATENDLILWRFIDD